MVNLLGCHGRKFEACIDGEWAEGKICVTNNGVFLCQNVADGNVSPITFGYAFSWYVGTGEQHELEAEMVSDLIITDKKPIITII